MAIPVGRRYTGRRRIRSASRGGGFRPSVRLRPSMVRRSLSMRSGRRRISTRPAFRGRRRR